MSAFVLFGTSFIKEKYLVECKLCYHVLFFLHLRIITKKACKRCLPQNL